MRIRVVSYNLRKGKGARPKAHSHHLADIAQNLARVDPDVLLCQEVYHDKGGKLVSQSAVIAKEARLDHRYEPNSEYRTGHHGNATMSRFDCPVHRVYDISTNSVERRGALYTRLAVGRTNLHVLNVHLGLNQIQRRAQVRLLAEIIEKVVPFDEPVVVGGDFNDWTGKLDPFIRKMCGLKNAMDLAEAKARRTWHAARPLFALDRLYVRGVEPVEALVLAGEPWTTLSDHLPIEITLALQPQHR